MDTEKLEKKNIASYSSIEAPGCSSVDSVNFSVRGAVKSKQVQPIFKVISSYDRRKLSSDKNVSNESQSSHDVTTCLEESKKKGLLYAKVPGPTWHKISNPMVTPAIIADNLSEQFKDLPIFGAPECKAKLEEYENKRIREFVGFDLDDTEFEELKNYCNPDNLKTGKEIKMSTSYPVQGLMAKNMVTEHHSDDDDSDEGQEKKPELWTLKRLRKRQKLDTGNSFPKLLKYRGVKMFPLREQEDNSPGKELEPPDLEPGKDVLYRIRIYRPFAFHTSADKQIKARTRHSVFNCDIVVTGRTPLTALRDRFSCRNDLDMRLDRSHDPDAPPTASAKSVFPSGFLFINNVFYVDRRAACRDTSEVVRRWALQRGLGAFPVRRMERRLLRDVICRLAYPEVYVHQGSCEHVFLFSEIRLLSRADPLHLAAYPCHTLMSQNQSIYCTTCAEFSAKWLVTGSDRVPFDPAFFCDICFREYLYKDGRKIGNFKAYAYRGNEVNVKNPAVSSYMMVIDYN